MTVHFVSSLPFLTYGGECHLLSAAARRLAGACNDSGAAWLGVRCCRALSRIRKMQVSEAACRDVQVEFSKGEDGNDASVAEFPTGRGRVCYQGG